MKKHTCLLLLLAVAYCYGCTRPAEVEAVSASAYFHNHWAMDSLWEQSLAEVAIYDAQRVVYGKPRQFEYTYVLVKETFNREFEVKTDDYERSDLFDVMKINKFARIPTDNYPYHYLTSIFFKRQQPHTVYKLTSTSQEWCGNTSKCFLSEGSHYTFGYNSYWDGQGIGQQKVTGDIMFEDQLSHSLRALQFAEGLSFRQQVAESQITNQATAPVIYEATFTVSRESNFTLQTGFSLEEIPEVWKVEVQLDASKTNTYWFAGNYPNILLRQTTWDGRKLQLQQVYMDDYWNL